MTQCIGFDFPRYAGYFQQGLDFGSKGDEIRSLVIIKRLYSETVSHQKKLLPLSIPQREGKHSAEMIHAPVAVFLVGMDNGFRVGSRSELVSTVRECCRQSRVVVNFA